MDADGYDADDDVTKCFELAYEEIRKRVANGGKGWTPKKEIPDECERLPQYR